jgi:hypothetical protein
MTVSRPLGLTALLPLRQSGAGYELSWTPWLEPGVATQAGVGPGYRDCPYHNPSCGLLVHSQDDFVCFFGKPKKASNLRLAVKIACDKMNLTMY